MSTFRARGKLRPLASAVRISPLFAAVPLALPGAASAATVSVQSNSGFPSTNCSIVDAVASINNGSLKPGANCTLTNADPFGTNDTVDLSAFSSPTTILFANVIGTSALTFLVPATIRGNLQSDGTPLVTIARSAVGPDFRLIQSGFDLALNGVALTGGYTAQSGGAVLMTASNSIVLSTLTLADTVLSNNHAGVEGGAVASYGSVTIANSIVTANFAGQDGGGVFVHSPGGSLDVTNSVISYNNAQNFGGGVIAGTMSMSNADIRGNSGSSGGGGIYLDGGTLSVRTSRITGNSTGSAGCGGGVCGPTGFVSIDDTTVADNLAQQGGGIYAASLSLVRSTVSRNTAVHGGGIFAKGIVSTNSTISSNQAELQGGGMLLRGQFSSINSVANLTFTTVTANALTGNTQQGAGVFESYSGAVTANAVTIAQIGTIAYGNINGTDVGFGNSLSLQVTGSADLIGTVDSGTVLPLGTLSCDPQLSPLAYHGGPTKTHAIPNASCAINVGPTGIKLPANDQRGTGFSRLFGPAPDIGAFEFQPTDTIFGDDFE